MCDRATGIMRSASAWSDRHSGAAIYDQIQSDLFPTSPLQTVTVDSAQHLRRVLRGIGVNSSPILPLYRIIRLNRNHGFELISWQLRT